MLERRNYIRYKPKPVPESHMGLPKRWVGLRSAHRHRLEERTRAIESRERTKPHWHVSTLLDEWFVGDS